MKPSENSDFCSGSTVESVSFELTTSALPVRDSALDSAVKQDSAALTESVHQLCDLRVDELRSWRLSQVLESERLRAADLAYDAAAEWKRRALDAEANLAFATSLLNDLIHVILNPTSSLGDILSYVERLEKLRGGK